MPSVTATSFLSFHVFQIFLRSFLSEELIQIITDYVDEIPRISIAELPLIAISIPSYILLTVQFTTQLPWITCQQNLPVFSELPPCHQTGKMQFLTLL
jgi:hypothetical protein